jgi:hypothetical protein
MNGISRRFVAAASEVGSEVHLAHETHAASGVKRVTSRKPRLLVWTNDKPNRRGGNNRELLERLEAENAELRDKAVVLALQIQALRDGQFEWRGCG